MEKGEKIFSQIIANSNVLTTAASYFTSPKVNTLQAFNPTEELASIGAIAVGNAGDTDSAPKTVPLKFDTNEVLVRVVAIPTAPGGTAKNFKVKSIREDSEWRSVDIEKKAFHDEKLNRRYISDFYVTADELGLKKGDYVTYPPPTTS